MEDIINRLTAALQGIWQSRWWAAALSWIVFAAGMVVVSILPDTYEATARAYVDTQNVLKPLLSSMTSLPNLEQQVSVMGRSLLNRPNLEKLIHMTGLNANVKDNQEFERLVESLRKDIKLSGTGRDDIYTITYNNRNPKMAHNVVQSLLTIFVDTSLGNKNHDTQKAVAFINDQISAYEEKLTAAENALKEFKIRNAEVLPREGVSYAARLAEVGDALAQAKLELSEAEHTRNALRKQIAGEEAVLAAGQNGGETEIESRLRGLYKSLDNLRMQFTDRHPDVISTTRLIEELEARRSQETVQRKDKRVRPPNDPVLQQLGASLAKAEANYAALSARAAEYSTRYARLKAMVKAVPEVESQLAGLNRDYQVNKENYEKLINRREAAKLSEELTTSGMVNFKIIEAPIIPEKPRGPNRPLLLTIVLALSLASGLGVGFLISQVRPVFISHASLREATGLPVFGSVSLNKSTAQRAREIRAVYSFSLVIAALPIAYLVAVKLM